MVLISSFFYIAALLIAHFDVFFTWRWVSFSFYILALLIPPVLLVANKWLRGLNRLFNRLDFFEKIIFFVVLFGSVWLYFYLLDKYPFVSLGDEIRDGGLNMRGIAQGDIKNIFSSGYANSFGLIFSAVLSPFFLLFSNTVYAYRVPGVLFGIADIFLVWVLLSFLVKKRKRIDGLMPSLGMLLIAIFPLHFFYSRTQVLIIAGCFMVTLLLILTMLFARDDCWENSVALALGCGFALNLHDSVKPVAFLLMIFFFISTLIKRKKDYLMKLLIFTFFVLVGFGPRILFISRDNFFQKGKINLNTRNNLFQNYHRSFFVYFNQPTESYYSYRYPLIPTYLQLFFAIGLITLILHFDTKIILPVLILVLPLTNSAVTNMLNLDYRLSPLFPMIIVTSVYGIWKLYEGFPAKKVSGPFGYCLIMITVLFGILLMFKIIKEKRFTDYDRRYYPFLISNLINFFKKTKMEPAKICLTVNGNIGNDLRAPHVTEFFDYFVPQIKVEINTNDNDALTDAELLVSGECDGLSKDIIVYAPCTDSSKFDCFSLNENSSNVLGEWTDEAKILIDVSLLEKTRGYRLW